MAYKFQVGPASLSGSLTRSGSMDIMNAVGVSKLTIDSSSGNLSGSGTADFGSNLQVKGTGHFEGALDCDTSLTVDAVTLTSAELAVLDGVTAGTAAASKALVLDASKDIATIRNLTIDGTFSDGNYTFDTSGNVTGLGTVGCGAITSTGNLGVTGTITGDTSLTLDTTTITTAEIGVLDGVTAGTAAASKALVLDASKDIGTIRNLTIDGTFSDGNYTFDTSGNVTGLGTVACGAVTSTANVAGTTLTGSTAVRTGGADAWGFSNAGVAKFGATAATTLSASSTLTAVGASNLKGAAVLESTLAVSGAATLAGTVTLSGVADTAVAVAADSFYYLDATDNLVKRDTMADYATALAGTVGNSALAASSGVLTLDIANVTAAAIATTDTILFNDQNGDVVRQETIDDVATLFVGDGLVANSAVISLDLNGLATAAVDVANDSLAIIDANASNGSKKESFADLATAMAGTGVTATNGVFSVDTTGGDSMSSVAIADGGTLAAGLNFFAAITANAAVTLPTPGAGDIIVLKAHTISDGEAITINRSGTQTIDGLTSIEIRSDYGAVTLIATAAGTACDWRIA